MTFGYNDYKVLDHANNGEIDDSFLNYAEGAADWLINEAILDGDGYKWRDLVGSNLYHTDLYYGSPGIISLFLELYELTTDAEYFQYAVGGAQWLIDREYLKLVVINGPKKKESLCIILDYM